MPEATLESEGELRVSNYPAQNYGLIVLLSNSVIGPALKFWAREDLLQIHLDRDLLSANRKILAKHAI